MSDGLKDSGSRADLFQHGTSLPRADPNAGHRLRLKERFVNGGPDSGWTGYSPQVQFSASSATPEPGTIGMMLGSLGVLGLVIRRRKA